MSGDTIECFNCGRANPAWAHVCRHCGVPLGTDERVAPATGFIPTDGRSLTSMAATIGSILVAVLIGVLLSNMNPTARTVGLDASPTPTPTPTVEPTEAPTDTPLPTATPVPPPAFPGTLAFGTGHDGTQITGQTDTFAPGSTFAHTLSMPEPLGVTEVREGVWRIAEDGTETQVVDPASNPLGVDPNAQQAFFGPISTDSLRDSLGGPGTFVLRVYRGEELLAEGRFNLTE